MLLQFKFRNRQSKAVVIIDFTEAPCYFFVSIKDEVLRKEFGTNISIATDFEKILTKPNRSLTQYDKLKVAIFEAMKTTMEFARVKELHATTA